MEQLRIEKENRINELLNSIQANEQKHKRRLDTIIASRREHEILVKNLKNEHNVEIQRQMNYHEARMKKSQALIDQLDEANRKHEERVLNLRLEMGNRGDKLEAKWKQETQELTANLKNECKVKTYNEINQKPEIKHKSSIKSCIIAYCFGWLIVPSVIIASAVLGNGYLALIGVLLFLYIFVYCP